MRVKHKPWAIPMLEEYEDIVIGEPETYRGRWAEVFNNDRDLALEIGTGKGQFIVEMAKHQPKTNFIGLDLQSDVLVMALKKILAEDEALPNLRLLWSNGQDVDQFFAPQSIATIYLNFSDPWPKRRHAKRRLTHPRFLAVYQRLLKPEGVLQFKTDNRTLFEYTLMTWANAGLYFEDVQLDLHAEEASAQEEVKTEYEEKFMAKGQPIYKLCAHFPEK